MRILAIATMLLVTSGWMTLPILANYEIHTPLPDVQETGAPCACQCFSYTWSNSVPSMPTCATLCRVSMCVSWDGAGVNGVLRQHAFGSDCDSDNLAAGDCWNYSGTPEYDPDLCSSNFWTVEIFVKGIVWECVFAWCDFDCDSC